MLSVGKFRAREKSELSGARALRDDSSGLEPTRLRKPAWLPLWMGDDLLVQSLSPSSVHEGGRDKLYCLHKIRFDGNSLCSLLRRHLVTMPRDF